MKMKGLCMSDYAALPCELLSKKISTEYALSVKDYPNDADPLDIILDAYGKAGEIFNPDSENSIATSTLCFYMENMDEALEYFIKDMDNFKALTALFKAYVKVQGLINKGNEALKEKFSSELIDNKDYYSLFDIDYYLEKMRVDGIEKALSELEEDINIRANTYYNTAYKEYLDVLPGFESIISTIKDL